MPLDEVWLLLYWSPIYGRRPRFFCSSTVNRGRGCFGQDAGYSALLVRIFVAVHVGA